MDCALCLLASLSVFGFVRLRLCVVCCVWHVCAMCNTMHDNWNDHPRDHPGKYLYYAGTFWLYLQSHFRLRNVALVCVLCAYNGDLTMALV